MSFVAVSVAVSVASVATSVVAQSKAANAQNRYRRSLGIAQNKQYEENAAAVVKDVGFQIDQLARRDIEQTAATRLELEKVTRDAREAGATTRAMAAVSGVEGRTVDLVHAQFNRDVADFASVAARNIQNFKVQSSMEAAAIYARGQNAINQGYPPPLPPAATVDVATNVLSGISTGLNVYGSLRSFQTPSGVGPAANPITNNPNAPYFLQANPTTSIGTPALLRAPTGGSGMSTPFFLSR